MPDTGGERSPPETESPDKSAPDVAVPSVPGEDRRLQDVAPGIGKFLSGTDFQRAIQMPGKNLPFDQPDHRSFRIL